MLVTNFHLKYFLYQVVGSAFQLFDVGRMHPAREMQRRALERTVDYIEKAMPNALGFLTQRQLLSWSLDQVKVQGHYLEFGVFTGGTIRFTAKKVKAGTTIHGFDSFEGLPEAWHGFDLGESAFSLKGQLPKVPDNVKLHKGWFNQTLPAWLKENGGPVAFIHLDCDIYSSTVDVLDALRDRLQVGTVILFDEYFNYPNWENHEYKAWREFIEKSRISYEYLGYARQQVAVKITAAPAS